MRNILLQSWTLSPRLTGLIAWIGLLLWGMPCGAQSYPPAQFQQISSYNADPSKKKGIRASIRRGFEGLAKTLRPKVSVKPIDDPVNLSTKSRPTARFHVAVARLYEQSNQLALAADQYERALQLSPDDLAALLGYARLKERLITPNEAASLYNRAVVAHPDEPAVFNNLGLFYAGRKMLDDSAAAFQDAIQLAPENPKYRNNLARVLVEQGHNAEAFRHLSSAHDPAVAYYNLGYLLERQGKPKFAAHHYAMALQLDSAFVHAQRGFVRVEHSLADLPPLGETPQLDSRRGGRPAGLAHTDSRLPADRKGVRTAGYNQTEQENAPRRRVSPSPSYSLHRLPPLGGAARISPLPAAPLPPQLSTIRPQPTAHY